MLHLLLQDIHKLPFTTKEDLRDNYPFGLLAVPKSKVARVQGSSGTTGKRIVVGYTDNDLSMWGGCFARMLVANTFGTFLPRTIYPAVSSAEMAVLTRVSISDPAESSHPA